jgi:hypothetical protein
VTGGRGVRSYLRVRPAGRHAAAGAVGDPLAGPAASSTRGDAAANPPAAEAAAAAARHEAAAAAGGGAGPAALRRATQPTCLAQASPHDPYATYGTPCAAHAAKTRGARSG